MSAVTAGDRSRARTATERAIDRAQARGTRPARGNRTGAGAEGPGRRLNNSHAHPDDARTMHDGPRRNQKGIAQETCPTITGERNTLREMYAQQCTRGHGGIQAAAHLRKLPDPNSFGVAEEAIASTATWPWYFCAWRTQGSLESQRRQADQGRRDESQYQNQIQPEPTTRHRVTSVFALIAVVSSLCRHLPSAPAGSSETDYTIQGPGGRKPKDQRFWFPSGVGCLVVDPTLSSLAPQELSPCRSRHENNHLIYQKGCEGQLPGGIHRQVFEWNSAVAGLDWPPCSGTCPGQ
jgi:hypothetical protein